MGNTGTIDINETNFPELYRLYNEKLLLTSEDWNVYEKTKDDWGDLLTFLTTAVQYPDTISTKISVELYANHKSVYDEGNASGDTLLKLDGTDQVTGSQLPSTLVAKKVTHWSTNAGGQITLPAATGGEYVFTLIIRKL